MLEEKPSKEEAYGKSEANTDINFYFHSFSCTVFFPTSSLRVPSGTYTGLENISDLTPDDPDDRWYHENRLAINAKSITLEKTPVIMRNGDKTYSVFDGGFYSYSGTLERNGDKYRVLLEMTNCDYCTVPYVRNPEMSADDNSDADMSFREQVEKGIYIVNPSFRHREYDLTIQKDGSLIMNGVRYEPDPAG